MNGDLHLQFCRSRGGTAAAASEGQSLWLERFLSQLCVLCLAQLCSQKVEEFHQTRSYDEAYKKGLEEECRKKEKDIQETEAAMYTLQNVNDYVTTQLQAREDEVVRDLFSASLVRSCCVRTLGTSKTDSFKLKLHT